VKWPPAALCGAVGLSLAVLGWSVTRPNYRELRLQDGTAVLGSNHGVWWMTRQFFSVRLENARPGSKLRSTARLVLRGREFVLRDITPSDLDGLGVEVSADNPADARHASMGFGDQNRDGALEFEFAGASLQRFYARCHRPAACDFELRWPGRPRFQLPMSEANVTTMLVDVMSASDHYWH
jgi:hypothetical protein